MKWSGSKEFTEALKGAHDVVQTFAAREVFETAKDLRDEALENFGRYGIRMITGRSRALFAAEPGQGLFERGQKFRLEAYAGYTDWPTSDAFDEDIPFYPYFLNYGTSKMAARPYYTTAVEKIESGFQARMSTAMDRALAAYFRGRTAT